jgi:hypothetical protein
VGKRKCWYCTMNRSNTVNIMTRLWAGRLGLDSRQGLGCLLLDTVSRPALGPIQPPIQWVSEIISPAGKATGAWSWPFTSI